jgi:hypothetical protein
MHLWCSFRNAASANQSISIKNSVYRGKQIRRFIESIGRISLETFRLRTVDRFDPNTRKPGFSYPKTHGNPGLKAIVFCLIKWQHAENINIHYMAQLLPL